MVQSRQNRTKQIRKAESDRDVALQVMIPPDVKRELNVRAAKEGMTQRTVVLLALRAFGFEIPDDDLYDRRKSRAERDGT